MSSTDIFFLSICGMITLVLCLLGYAVHMENMHSKGCHEELIKVDAYVETLWRCEKKNEETPLCR